MIKKMNAGQYVPLQETGSRIKREIQSGIRDLAGITDRLDYLQNNGKRKFTLISISKLNLCENKQFAPFLSGICIFLLD